MRVFFHDCLRPGFDNFGDAITRPIFEKVLGLNVVWSRPHRCDMAGIGSLLHHFQLGKWRSHYRFYRLLCPAVKIWGNGFLRQDMVSRRFGPVQFHGLRGERTREVLKGVVPADIAPGDAGLFVCHLVTKPSRKNPVKPIIGIVPHAHDRDAVKNMFAAMKPSDFGTLRLIDVTAEPLGVLEDIAQCDLVVSSSLHGIIAADALGIENIWARFTDLREDAFKFEDYFTGVGAFVPKQADLREDINPDVFQQHARLTPAPDLDKARERMLDAFPFPEKLQLTEPWKTQREIG